MKIYSINTIEKLGITKEENRVEEIKNEVKVEGIYGGVEVGNGINMQGGVTGVNSELGTGVAPEVAGTQGNLPAKTGFWNKLKSILFYEIKVELTPHQQKIENEINEFLHQEITWKKVKNFLFQEIKF